MFLLLDLPPEDQKDRVHNIGFFCVCLSWNCRMQRSSPQCFFMESANFSVIKSIASFHDIRTNLPSFSTRDILFRQPPRVDWRQIISFNGGNPLFQLSLSPFTATTSFCNADINAASGRRNTCIQSLPICQRQYLRLPVPLARAIQVRLQKLPQWLLNI